MKYVKKGETYYAMTQEQFELGRRYEFTIEAVRDHRNDRLRGYEVYPYDGSKRLTNSNDSVYFHSLKAAKEAVFDAYNSRKFEAEFNSVSEEECVDCNGTGANDSRTDKCPECKGRGTTKK